MLDYSVRTERGTREINEDSAAGVRRKDGIYLFVVADGLGGHGKGDIASSFVTKQIVDYFLKTPKIDEYFIADAIENAQELLLNKKKSIKNPNSMLTTAVILIADENHFQFGHIGDSRVYHFKNKEANIRSRDHSVPQILCESGEISEDEIRNHPERNKIVRALGIEGECFQYDISEVMPYDKNDSFLLCTDGFWENVLEYEMEDALADSESAEIWQNKMYDIIKKKKIKSLDNNTSVAVISKIIN